MKGGYVTCFLFGIILTASPVFAEGKPILLRFPGHAYVLPEKKTGRLPIETPATSSAWVSYARDNSSYRSCLSDLTALGVSYQEEPPVTSDTNPACGIADPVRIDLIQPEVSLEGSSVMRCETARQLALWVRNEAQPAVHLLSGSPYLTEILTGSVYQCRRRIGGKQTRLSEHASGNAFDVAGLRLSTGDILMIRPRDDSGEIEESVQKAIHYGACLYFTTVLGPGSNAAHDDHLHFDIKVRNAGWRICE